MKKLTIVKHISKILVCVLATCTVLVGCSPTVRSKQEVPQPDYTQAGYAIESSVNAEGKIVFTYALLGTKEDKIEYLHLDQIETNPKSDRHTFTNRELETAYGLIYKGNKGEWHEQTKAICTYISGNKMTIDEVNAIPTYQKDEENTMVPKEGSELASACELDLKPFISVINKAYNSRKNADLMYIKMGEDVRVNNSEGRLDVTFAFVGTDYRYKVQYAELETYSYIVGENGPVKSWQEKSAHDDSVKTYAENERAFEQYIIGLNLTEVNQLETYDAGDGINTAMPKKNSELAKVCSIDIGYFKKAIAEAS